MWYCGKSWSLKTTNDLHLLVSNLGSESVRKHMSRRLPTVTVDVDVEHFSEQWCWRWIGHWHRYPFSYPALFRGNSRYLIWHFNNEYYFLWPLGGRHWNEHQTWIQSRGKGKDEGKCGGSVRCWDWWKPFWRSRSRTGWRLSYVSQHLNKLFTCYLISSWFSFFDIPIHFLPEAACITIFWKWIHNNRSLA